MVAHYLARGYRRTLWTAAVLALFALFSAGDLWSWGGVVGRHLWIDSGWTLAGLLATVVSLSAARRSTGPDRRVWGFFALGCTFWEIGQLFWDYYELGPGFPPGPTFSDAGLLLFAPACMAGFAFMVAHSRLGKLLLALDASIVVSAVSIVCVTVFWSDIRQSPLSLAGQATAILYPVLYITLTLSILCVPIRRAWRSATLRWVVLGMALQAIPFTLWTPLELRGAYSEGKVLDIVWMAGLLAIAAGAGRFDGFPEVEDEGQLFGYVAYIPLVAAGVGATLRLSDGLIDPGFKLANTALHVMVCAIVLLMIARLAITLAQGRSLLHQTHDVLGALRESEARFRAIFLWAPFGIEIADTEGRLVATNRALQEMLGYTEDELRNIGYEAISHPDDVAKEAEFDEKLITRELDHYQLVKRHIRKDGSPIWTRLTASSIRGLDDMDKYAVGMVEDITERKQAEEQLEYHARHDSLTGLPNRHHLLTRLEEALETARREGGSCALLLMDLDRFKEINDTFGHPYGDALLCDVAARLGKARRRTDAVGRLGGDEFAVVLPAAAMADARQVVEGILRQFEQPFSVMGQTLHVGTSIGIACFPEHGLAATELMRQADIAMYEAKSSGTRASAYSAEQDRQAQRRLILAGALRDAIEEDQLFLHYQPKAECVSGRITGVEALVRWHHPVHGLIQPDEFIPLAEHSGLILPLTHWVIDEALREAGRLRAGGRDIRVWINVSARTLHDHSLPDAIHQRLRSHRAKPDWLGLEVTESAVMDDPDRALEILQSLADAGIHIAIDDFGTGYSSLSYLQRLPVRELKIDRAFVMRMGEDRGNRSIVQATINLAHDLGIEVVAEGVEHAAAWRQLSALRCDHIQGYFLSRPIPSAELSDWLEEHEDQPRRRLLAL